MLESMIARFVDDLPAPQKVSEPVVESAIRQQQPEPAPKVVVAEPIVGEVRCEKCRGIHYWQPKGLANWYCMQCEPPPALSMVGNERNQPRIISRCAYYAGRVVCSCGCHQVVETIWDDGLVNFECSSCQTRCLEPLR